MNGDRLGIGIIGCGAMGDAHAQAIAELSAVRLVAVFDQNVDRSRAMAIQYGAELTKSSRQLVERADVDAVIVASPTPDHLAATLLAARSGKHILLEKPAALSLADLEQMQSICDGAGVTLMVGQTMRFDSIVRAARETCIDGHIGDPVYVNWVSNTARRWPGGWQGWQTDRSQSGGMALHLGIHFIDLALWLLNDAPSRVYAQGNNVAAPSLNVYDYLQISIRCENGTNALLESHSSLSGAGTAYTGLRVVGTKGQLQWNSEDDGTYIGASGPQALTFGKNERLKQELLHFADCCTGGASPIITSDQVWYALAAAIAAAQSLEEGQAVNVAQIRRGGSH